jgi:asparagine synthase (glutamine-hydrolysing)
VRGGVKAALETLPVLRADLRRKLSHTFLGRELNVESLFLDNFYAAFSANAQAALRGAKPEGVYDEYLRHWNARPDDSLVARMLYADIKTYLVELLMKQDQMSMAASIESRVPFLDHHFVGFAMSMPDRMKLRGSEQKYALKKAVEGLIPDDIIYRKKMGFPTPLKQWFRDAASDELLGSLAKRDAFIARWVRPEAVAELIASHRAGFSDGTDRLWRLLNLELWGRVFFTGGAQAGADLAAERLERIAV